MVFIIFGIAPADSSSAHVALGIHLVAAVVLFSILGILAAFSGRSWLRYGVLPILLPILGPVTAYWLLRKQGKEAGWL